MAEDLLPVERIRESHWKKKKKVKQVISLPDTEFKKLVIKMLTELRKNVSINAEHCIRDLETVKMNQNK